MDNFPKIISSNLFSREAWRRLRDYVGLGRSGEETPVVDVETLQVFLNTRASHVAQTSLYGYMKTRAGTRYPELFENPGMLWSINIAKWQIWLACLSDLTIYVGVLIKRRTGTTDERIKPVLEGAIRRVLAETGLPADAGEGFAPAAAAISERIATCDFGRLEDGEDAFSESPEALVRWSPIADELKSRDVDIVRNSVRFRWQEIRRSARRLLREEDLLRAVT